MCCRAIWKRDHKVSERELFLYCTQNIITIWILYTACLYSDHRYFVCACVWCLCIRLWVCSREWSSSNECIEVRWQIYWMINNRLLFIAYLLRTSINQTLSRSGETCLLFFLWNTINCIQEYINWSESDYPKWMNRIDNKHQVQNGSEQTFSFLS